MLVHVDNLLIASKSPQIIIDALINKRNFKAKGTEPFTYHLAFDITRDVSNKLCLVPRK